MDSFVAPCAHSQHHGMETCPGLTPDEIAFGEKVRSVGLQFTYGRDTFHGPTIGEQVREHVDNAERYGNPPPEYAGERHF